MLETETGVVLHASVNELLAAHSSGPVSVPTPSCPVAFDPQHFTVPSDSSTQAKSLLTATPEAVVTPETVTGVEDEAVFPSPSPPARFTPQHFTLPTESKTQNESGRRGRGVGDEEKRQKKNQTLRLLRVARSDFCSTQKHEPVPIFLKF